MRLTETQKNFRKHMQELEREKYGSRNHSSWVNKVFYLFIAVIILLGVAILAQKPNTNPSAHDFFTEGINQRSVGVTASNERVLPYVEANEFKKISRIHDEFQLEIKQIEEFHSTPWENRDLIAYRQALIDGIVSANTSLAEHRKLNTKGMFKEIASNNENIYINTGLAFEYYLSYLTSKKNYEIELGNEHINKANFNRQQMNLLFIEILDQGKYKYDVLEDGEIRYYYQIR